MEIVLHDPLNAEVFFLDENEDIPFTTAAKKPEHADN